MLTLYNYQNNFTVITISKRTTIYSYIYSTIYFVHKSSIITTETSNIQYILNHAGMAMKVTVFHNKTEKGLFTVRA